MAGIQMTGLASGLDTETIITQLLNVERAPRTSLTLKGTAAQAKSDALKDISAKLNSLKLAATALRSAGTWGDTQSVDSGDATKVAVRTVAGAAPGGHTVTVTGLARGAQSVFDYAPPAADDTITVNGHAVALKSGASLDDAVTAINGDESSGVYAVNVGGRLALSSKTTGAAAAATATGTSVSNGTTLAGADAAFTVDGVGYTRSTNVVTDALAGVELTLKGVSTGTAVTVTTPGPSKDAVVDAAKAFVTAYNATVDAIRSRTSEERVPNAATAADAKKGVLFNDSGLNGILSSLRRSVSSTVPGLVSTLDEASEVGLTTGKASGGTTLDQDAIAGKLKLDATLLRAKLDSDPTGVQKLFGGSASAPDKGIAQALETVLEPLTQAGGTFSGRIDSVNGTIASLKTGLARFDDRIAARETSLRKQFTALELALQKSNDTLARVQKQFS
jgi:flagellar hook-associated protein 2